MSNELNLRYRNGGDLVEGREEGRNTVSRMELLRSRSDMLGNALREMGVTPKGDADVAAYGDDVEWPD